MNTVSSSDLIPQDIQQVINNLDREKMYEYLPKSNSSINKYDDVINQLFKDSTIINITEFEYGRSYRYLIYSVKNDKLTALDSSILSGIVADYDKVECIKLAISAVSNYLLIEFSTYSLDNEDLVEIKNPIPISSFQVNVLNAIEGKFSKLSYKVLSPEISSLVIPDISTELCDVGETTIGNSLFFG